MQKPPFVFAAVLVAVFAVAVSSASAVVSSASAATSASASAFAGAAPVTSALRAGGYLQKIPGPDDTGGMVMPLVSLDFGSKRVAVNMAQGNTVSMYPLQQYKVWGQYPYADALFAPALADAPWYDLLDPTRQHLPFSTQFGFELISGNAHLIPAGAYVYIRATALSEGLRIYDVGYWEDVWAGQGGEGAWSQVFGEGNFGGTISPELDNVAAWGDGASIKMWHPVALVSAPGLYSARFEIYVGDGMARQLDGWSAATLDLHWQAVAVPEPALAAALGALAVFCAAAAARRRCGKAATTRRELTGG